MDTSPKSNSNSRPPDPNVIPLNGAWQLTFGPQTDSGPATSADLPKTGWPAIPAAVPGNVLFAGAFSVARNGSTILASIPPATKPAMWLLEWTVAGGPLHRNHYLAGPRPFSLARYKTWLKKLGLTSYM